MFVSCRNFTGFIGQRDGISLIKEHRNIVLLSRSQEKFGEALYAGKGLKKLNPHCER